MNIKYSGKYLSNLIILLVLSNRQQMNLKLHRSIKKFVPQCVDIFLERIVQQRSLKKWYVGVMVLRKSTLNNYYYIYHYNDNVSLF
jgi:hypothetical protein